MVVLVSNLTHYRYDAGTSRWKASRHRVTWTGQQDQRGETRVAALPVVDAGILGVIMALSSVVIDMANEKWVSSFVVTFFVNKDRTPR